VSCDFGCKKVAFMEISLTGLPHDSVHHSKMARGPTKNDAATIIFHGCFHWLWRAKHTTANKFNPQIESTTASATTEARDNADDVKGVQDDSPLEDTNSAGHLTGCTDPETKRELGYKVAAIQESFFSGL
jgi:hypothetical protein